MDCFSIVHKIIQRNMSKFPSKIHHCFKNLFKRHRDKPDQKETKAESAVTASYDDDFEPFCKWHKEEEHVTLVVHLPDFKKEQLNVHINSHGMLKITGERPVEGTKKSRFCKQIEIPSECNANGIHAKFTDGRLHVMMPKKIISVQESTENRKPAGKEESTKNSFVGELSVAKLERSRKVMIMSSVVAVVVTVVLALGAYVTYRYRNSYVGINPPHPLDD